MSAGLCLSRDEVTELCRTPQRARQLAFLRSNGIRHYLDHYGRPVILRSAVEGAAAPRAAATVEWRSNKVV
ncbi:DUF4224 domain-containing protein [Xanthomonas campestris pv. raphani]|uniref:DUF4224 domain-containing protein n=1 Tax=Xanthomonas hortorum TaxID=56454 RepID=A0AA47EWC7_9XANT|nr:MULTISPECIES: DUF4224 domain-containing protein [Xanthomonas]MEA9906103.1 DUF4224 domain-containing protein [Xanthomonas campestris pv. raphani]WAH66065.1 DUF4224 domain-containing protein [Xanthomonas hortorum]